MSSSSEPAVCHKEHAAKTPPSLFQDGRIVIQLHHIGWIVSGCFTIVAIAISFWLVNKHLQWYTNKREQRYIVRLLFMVPLYAIISFASYLWWNHATPLILIRDAYESTVLTAFFYLLLMYLSPDPEEQRRIFAKYGLSKRNDAEKVKKGEKVQRWVFPLGFVKWKPVDGLYFLQLMKWGVLQYCVIRPLTTLAAVILDYVGLYCESSWGLGWGHVYIVIIVSLSVTIAMYCLIQLYVSVSKDLARHKPLLKLFAVKAVVFLTFWQATFLSLLTMFGVVKGTEYMTADDINIGIGALLETFEMMLFALLHVRAFTYKPYQLPYDPDSDLFPPSSTPRWKSLGHAMDFRETFRELWNGCIYMWHRFRGKEPTLDIGAVRSAHYEGVFGKQRPSQIQPTRRDEEEKLVSKQPTLPQVQVEVTENVEVDIGGEKQWLGLGDDYGYGLRFLRKERSEALEEQIEKELEKRGYTLRQPKHPKEKSWWRSLYNRISQTGHESNEGREIADPSHSRSQTRGRSRRKCPPRDHDAGRHLLAHADFDLEDQPPISIIRKNRQQLHRSVDKWRQTVDPGHVTDDVLMPLSGYAEHRRGLMGVGDRPPVSVTSEAVVPDPGRVQSPVSDGSLSRLFPPAENDLFTEPGHEHVLDSARSVVSSTEGYKLTQPTPRPMVTSPITILPQLVMAGERRSTMFHLADGDTHVPMTATVLDVGNIQGPPNSTSPSRMHRRESANHKEFSPVIPQAGPSTPSARSGAGLRRSSAQYRPFKPTPRQMSSPPPPIDTSYPLLPITSLTTRTPPYQSHTPGLDRQTNETTAIQLTQNFTSKPLPSPPLNGNNSIIHSPVRMDDRYPLHILPTYPTMPRHP